MNATHKWHPYHRPNKTVLRAEADIDGYMGKLREIIVNGYDAAPPKIARRRDESAGKRRDILEPRLWLDRYVHHVVIQVLESVLMRGMNKLYRGSIKGQGIHYDVKAIRKWMQTDPEGTKYTEELDIHRFHDSLTIEAVAARLRRLVKNRKMLDVCERLMKYGALTGAFFSQWFVNMVLQPLDQMIRSSGLCGHYMQYMDNLTLFGRNERKLRKLWGTIEDWFAGRRLKLSNKWQLYPTVKWTVAALGYRLGHKFSLPRKWNMMRLKKSLSECY